MSKRKVEIAIGTVLDNLGGSVMCLRLDGETDADYRARLLQRFPAPDLVAWSAEDIARWKIKHRVEQARRDAAYRRSQKDNFRGYTHAQPPKPHYMLRVRQHGHIGVNLRWWLATDPTFIPQRAGVHVNSGDAIRNESKHIRQRGILDSWGEG